MDEYKRRRRRSRAVMSMFLDRLGGTIDNVDVADFYSDGSDLKALIVGIEPIQDLHGYDNPWPAGGGANLFDIDNPFITASTANYLTTYAPKVEDGKFYNGGKLGEASGASITIPVEAESTYTVQFVINGENATWEVRAVTLNGNVWTSNIVLANNQSAPLTGAVTVTVTIPSGKTHLFVACYSATKQGSWETNIQIEKGSTATAWSPFSNICPITGHSSVNVIVSPTLNPLDGTITNIPLGGTYYGGQLDVLTGVLTVTHANISSYNGEAINEPWISSMDAYSSGDTPTTGAQVVYPLSTPTTIQLTGQQIATFVGTNHVWCDSGKIIHLEY